MEKQRILITVKTYPTLSWEHGETVCTAGLREDGSWVRIYPVPFRRLDEPEQYRKFDWVQCRLKRKRSDPRPETHSPVDESELVPVAHVDTREEWRQRRRLVLQTAKVFDSIDDIIARAKANEISLAVFKPTRIVDFVWEEEEEREWDPAKVKQMRELTNQLDLFRDNTWRATFRLIPKLPYGFFYRLVDCAGRESKLKVLDWEVGALYWNCLRSAGGDEPTALAKVKQKYLDAFLPTDLHFFLGTTAQFHSMAPNPWVIVGVFPIPHQRQGTLF